jgi:hypothetical protein
MFIKNLRLLRQNNEVTKHRAFIGAGELTADAVPPAK